MRQMYFSRDFRTILIQSWSRKILDNYDTTSFSSPVFIFGPAQFEFGQTSFKALFWINIELRWLKLKLQTNTSLYEIFTIVRF